MQGVAIGIGIGIMAFGLGVARTSSGFAASVEAVQAARPEAPGAATLLVPAYFYPSGPRRADWTRLAEAARSVPMEVILNPDSGPGPRRDPNYVAVLDELRRSGARVLAYVDSDYGRRPLADVDKDLRTYPMFYRIDGYFIDQMANRPESVDHYRSIRQRIRQIDPLLRVVANPGTYTRPEYLETADALVTFEGSAKDFADYNPRAATPWIVGQPPRRFAAMVYDVRDAAAGRDALSRATRAGAGSVYVTDQKMPNPYLGLPPYWADQVAAIRSMNETRKAAEAPPSRP